MLSCPRQAAFGAISVHRALGSGKMPLVCEWNEITSSNMELTLFERISVEIAVAPGRRR